MPVGHVVLRLQWRGDNEYKLNAKQHHKSIAQSDISYLVAKNVV